MDALALRRAHCFAGPGNVIAAGARQAADHRRILPLAQGLRDRFHRIEIAGRGDREAGFQHIHAQFRERLRHADLLVDVHGKSGRLLAVAQRGIEDDDAVVFQLAEAGMFDGHRIGPRERQRSTMRRGSAPGRFPWAMRALSDPAARSGARKSKKCEGGDGAHGGSHREAGEPADHADAAGEHDGHVANWRSAGKAQRMAARASASMVSIKGMPSSWDGPA